MCGCVPPLPAALRHRQRGRRSVPGRRGTPALLAGAVLTAGRRFDYSEAGQSPDELLEPHHSYATAARWPRSAQKVWIFRRRSTPSTTPSGNAVTTGSAERATYYTERKDAELAGSIRLRSDSQEVRLEADTLRWEDQRRRLVTGPEAVVEILRDDGSQVTGTGLEVDVRRKTIRFTDPVSGTLVTRTDGPAPR